MSPNELKDKSYLEDGLYIGHDGFQLWLYAERENGMNMVALEPHVLKTIERYVELIAAKNQAAKGQVES